MSANFTHTYVNKSNELRCPKFSIFFINGENAARFVLQLHVFII